MKEFVTSEASITYLNSFTPRAPKDLKTIYPGADNRGLDLLKKMLEFNPNKRITAMEAIEDSYFDDVRLPG